MGTLYTYLVGRQNRERHRVHGRIGEIFEVDGNVPFPHSQAFVVGGGDESTIAIDKRYRVDGTLRINKGSGMKEAVSHRPP